MSFSPKEIAKTLPEEKQILAELILANRALALGLRKILYNPKIKSARREIIETTLSPHVSAPIINLIYFLAQENRLRIFGKIVEEYRRVLDQKKKGILAEITTAEKLSKEDLTHYERKLEEKIHAPVYLQPTVDPTILGGAILKIGSRTIDNSFRTKLKALK